MILLDLPDEMLLLIAENLDDARHISSFAQVTKRTYILLRSTLYKFDIQQKGASALLWAIQRNRSGMVEMMLQQYKYNVNAIYNSNTPLICAVLHKFTAVVDVLLADPEVDVNFQNKSGYCALWWAAFKGCTHIVQQLLKRDDIQVNLADREDRRTPLSVAVMQGHLEIVQDHLLKSKQVDVNTRDRNNHTPIFHALARQDRKMTGILLGNEKLDLSCQDRTGRSPLIYSLYTHEPDLTRMLLGHPRPHVDLRDRNDRTALWHAVQLQNGGLTQLLLENGADINAQDIGGMSPIHISITMGKPSILQMLLEYSCQGYATFSPHANHGIGDEIPLLCLAAYWGKRRVVQFLINHGWDVNEVNAEQRTPLHLAVEEGHYSVVRVLLNQPQINLHAQDQQASTALHEAAEGGHLPVVNLLLAKPSININIKDTYGATPLWWATRCRNDGVAARLLAEPNVDVNAIGHHLRRPGYMDRSTSLHHAVQARAIGIIRQLLAVTNLNPNVTDHLKRTPLGWAAMEGDVQTVELLLTRSDVLVNTGGGEQTPLWLAATGSHTQVVDRLVQCPGIDINKGWGPYQTPLLAAIIKGHSNVAMPLLACGEQLDTNAETYEKESALSLAARQGDLQVVDSILQNGRTNNHNIVDNRGRTALWWAAYSGKTTVVERLLWDDHVLVNVKDDEGIDAMAAARMQDHSDIVSLLAQRSGHRQDSIASVV
ncbi:hypothetical protein Asppvi_003792 [Aspergillus pseudoviridinutans]|uniref:F-box domain-containing protein n=1 Tax=Aspergillus pseudoviridinutans TaxID=1517512 RepID=A0A9P3ESQ0_9EURO|nr:uncharacterized protein Asppvi_003792 [Aspergillus pseudoviridinutans]GIJ84937.1 hypothetical protein Asppvi_003792 [Aspergillus pseudoviridinutans]